ncbi:MAG: carboxylesterase/lipase family protein [Armatimonadota bacterium]
MPLAAAASADDAPPIATTCGPVSGLIVDGVRVFKGIPYAAPPVGELRWQPPVPPTPWTQPRAAVAFSAACPQAKDRIVPLQALQSEDCLYLNVWSAQQAQKLPVMVFIHGGGFSKGSSAQSYYDSPALARHGVVLVTINYRLGDLGFFCHPALTAESAHHASGNYGLLDQVAALQWVRDNIAAFGGDPGRVTIFGESAGAVSVGLLMASPLARGLFHRAIMESGSAPLRMKTREEMETRGLELQRKLGVADGPEALAQLRALPADKLLVSGAGDDALPGMSVRNLLCVDGYFLPEAPAKVYAEGRQAAVPLLAGTNADEGTLWSQRLPLKTVGQWRAMLRVFFKQDAPQAEALYPVASEADLPEALNQFLGDPFLAGARRAARWSQPVQARTHLYHFTHRSLISERSGLGVFHGSELVYVFGSLPPSVRQSPEEGGFSETMMGYWTRFAATGDPNGGDAVAWPEYTQDNDRYLGLDTVPTVGACLRKAQCDFWDEVQGQ